MPENTQEQKLDYALEQLDTNLLLWGIDNWLGYRTAETMKLSVAGATNLVALVNTLNSQIARLEMVILEMENTN
jgi:hypothetical protein